MLFTIETVTSSIYKWTIYNWKSGEKFFFTNKTVIISYLQIAQY